MLFKSTKIYNVYIKKNDIEPLETAEFLEEGFSLYAFIFGILWGVYNKTFIFIICAIIIQAMVVFLLYLTDINLIAIYIFKIASNILLAFEANNLRCKSLKRKKYILYDIVTGQNLLEAQQRFFDRAINNNSNDSNNSSINIFPKTTIDDNNNLAVN